MWWYITIGCAFGASFIAGVYFAEVVKAPALKIVDWIKSAVAKVKA